ncbi:hypothetical protein SNE510_09590 [Streptomyces sp. NE5-10]|nr:hypothetical protein SNE510_09590 [Streptomyces sp. NE5-10]
MAHRSVVGSVERAVAHLVERHGGTLPAWPAPTQPAILPVSDAELPHATALARRCVSLGLRADVAAPDRGTLAARVRTARLVPYQAVIGAREAAAGSVPVRLRDGRRPRALPDRRPRGVPQHRTAGRPRAAGTGGGSRPARPAPRPPTA